MDTLTLTLFVEVMREHSFTDVARAHGMAPSSVSRAMSGLEAELGVRLFQRTTRRLEPTEAGMAYFQRIVPVLDELHAARDAAADLSEQPKGTLRVTAATVYGEMYIVPQLPQLAEKYPQLSIELLLTDAYLDMVEERIDVAVRLGTLQDSSLIARQLSSMAFFVCASPDYLERHGVPVTLTDMQQHNCLLFPRSGYSMNWLFKDNTGQETAVSINGRCLITHSRAIRDSAIAGMGLALLPDWLVGESIRAGKLVRLYEEYAVTPTDYNGGVWLLCPSRDYLPLKTRVFMDHLVENIRH